MTRKNSAILLAVILLLSGLASGFVLNSAYAGTPAATASAKTATTAAPVRLFYYQESATAQKSLYANYKAIQVFVPEWYSFSNSGQLLGAINPDVLSFVQAHNIEVMPLVSNGNFSQASYQTLLNDPAMEASAIASLVSEAKLQGYAGWQIDFEQMDASYQSRFSAFIAEAAAALHANGLKLSVAVVAQVSTNPKDYPNNLWQTLIGAYDYVSLGQSADFLSLMTYDDPNSTGPIVEYSWLTKVLAYSLSVVPAGKLSLGIPLYNWQWDTTEADHIGAGTWTGLQTVMKTDKVTFHYNTTQEEGYATYTSQGDQYVIWYETAQSIAQKIGLVKKDHLLGFSAWALGQELPQDWNAL